MTNNCTELADLLIAKNCAYESMVERGCNVSREAFDQLVCTHKIVPVRVLGVIKGAVMIDGPEIHACIVESVHKRWMTRTILRLLDQLRMTYGYAQTSVLRGNQIGVCFVLRLGFKPYQILENKTVYRWA